ncbi:hypothetical protein CSC74_03130 [Pseudoxanthomonas yeongjuensis]|uniref:hypothetical protein n=1 Tax=Pseudoxanthomonas yeongjuensis TaxID=377616 RepID=UPI0013913B16|nr:hypothetical protein [Pseudoxanthomonas yeongjuensis]KAF1717914.1 hypothetical protein CSC74_03130 [Pseudoxanthomonas yeongjuensis]
MTTDEIVATYAVLYGPSVATLANTMPDMGEAISTQCQALRRDPTVDACEVLAANLDGARRAVLRLREALMREGSGDGQ